jgi:PAS domain-containing protein
MNHELTAEALSHVLKLGWDYTKDAMVVADTESGLLVECNPALEAVTGYSRSEIIGMPFFMLHPEAERAPKSNCFPPGNGTGWPLRGISSALPRQPSHPGDSLIDSAL